MGARMMTMSSDELKVGDKIAVISRFRPLELHTIERVTQTMYVCKHKRFRKDGLGIVGADTWGPFRGQVVTPEIMTLHRIEMATQKLKTLKVTANNLEAIEALFAGGEDEPSDD